jgi:hypothetical protein
MKRYVLFAATIMLSANAFATPCEEVKTAIAAKLDAKHVSGYTLDVVAADQAGSDAKVVGTCEAGAKKIVYTKK